MRRLLLLLLLLPSLPLDAARDGGALDLSLPELGDPASRVMTPASERAIGERMMRTVRQQLPMLDDPAINAYVNDLGRRLASHSGTANGDHRFFVVNDPRINAFAMPGGFIGVNSGLILEAETESQLASVVAHELAHVTQRHLVRQLEAGQRTGLRTAALILAGVLLGMQDPEAGSAAAISGMASAAQEQLTYSRAHEREADHIGMRILDAARFDPQGMAEFFEKLGQASRYSTEPPPFLSTHPMTQSRIADARNRSESLQPEEVFENPVFPLLRERLRALEGGQAGEMVDRYRKELEGAEAEGRGHALRYGLAVALRRAGEHDRSLALLDELIAEHGEYPPYYLARGEVQQAAGAPAEAVETYRDALELFPGDHALRYRLIQALLDAGAPQEARQIAAEATRDAPEDPALWRLHARAASDAGNEAEATLAVARAYRLEGDLATALDQVERVTSMPSADEYQRSRASALRERWQAERRDQEGQQEP